MPPSRREYQFAELPVDNSILEAFSKEMSAYAQEDESIARRDFYAAFRRKLLWHINHSLSTRQRQTLLLILSGKTEREAASVLAISQQVVHIYKWRAVNKLKEILLS